MVGEADRIKNQMVMNMSLINMGGKYKLVLATQYFFCQLHPDLMCFLWRHLTRLKGLDQVAIQVRARVIASAVIAAYSPVKRMQIISVTDTINEL